MSERRMTSIVALLTPLAAFRDVRQERHLTCALDGDSDLPLVPPARAGDAPGADLAPLRDVPAQLVHVLVVDLVDLVLAEEARLPANRTGGLAGTFAPRRPVLVSLFSSSARRHQNGMSSSAEPAKSSLPAVAAAGT